MHLPDFYFTLSLKLWSEITFEMRLDLTLQEVNLPAEVMAFSGASCLLALSMDCRTTSVLKDSTCRIFLSSGNAFGLISSRFTKLAEVLSSGESKSLLTAEHRLWVCTGRIPKGGGGAGGRVPCPLAYASRRWELSLRMRACGGKGPS